MKSERRDRGLIAVVATNPALPTSGNPCRFGTVLATSLLGVAVIDERADGLTTVDFERDKVFALGVRGHDGTNPAAVLVGDRVFYNDGVTGTVDGVAGVVVLNAQVAGAPFGTVIGITSPLAQGVQAVASGSFTRVLVYKTA